MKVAAPGKLMITGAYAVLEGATAVVAAVARYAVADPARHAPASREVQAALGEPDGPVVDTSALYDGPSKLGLGSSAAVLVASIATRMAAGGADLSSPAVREAIFRVARGGHAAAQGGGSGVDVAASVWGGVLAYAVNRTPRALALPADLRIEAVWSGVSARTSDLRARVDAFAARDQAAYRARIRELGDASEAAVASFERGDARGVVAAGQATSAALAALGRDAAAPIVPAGMDELSRLAEAAGASFFPSGAGGGDVAVYLGTGAPSASLLARAADLGMRPLGVSVDARGVHPLD
jgi:phosphomevalonate kinase